MTVEDEPEGMGKEVVVTYLKMCLAFFENPRTDLPHRRNSIGCFRHEARVVCPVTWG